MIQYQKAFKKWGTHKFLIVFVSCILINSCSKKTEKVYYDNGQLRYEAKLKNGKWHGLVKQYSKSGNLLAESIYENGVQEGKGVKYFENGNIEQINNYSKGEFTGKSAFFRKDGSLFTINEYNVEGKLIDYVYYLDSGTILQNDSLKHAIIISNSDTITKGEIFKAEIRLGHKYYNNIYAFLGNPVDDSLFFKEHLPRKNNIISILEIDTDTCELGVNKVVGAILELDREDSFFLKIPFIHFFYINPSSLEVRREALSGDKL